MSYKCDCAAKEFMPCSSRLPKVESSVLVLFAFAYKQSLLILSKFEGRICYGCRMTYYLRMVICICFLEQVCKMIKYIIKKSVDLLAVPKCSLIIIESQNHRMVWKGPLRLPSSNPLLQEGTPPTRPCCSKPHSAWP